jgi:hypothetical protein
MAGKINLLGHPGSSDPEPTNAATLPLNTP